MTDAVSLSPAHHPAEVPSNLYKPTAPFKAKVVENTVLTGPGSPNDVRHIVINFEGSDYWYLEGQSAGILPPGADENGKAHKLRLYSIASAAEGDDGTAKTLSLCVKRVVYNDPESGKEVRGVCSNFLCDSQPGDTVDLCGPTGKGFLMPEAADANMIMIATGTGIAPFRGFIRHRYKQRAGEKGQTWMIFGAQYRSDYLYGPELEAYNREDTYKLITAFSREEMTADGQRMYVQHRVAEHQDALLTLLEQPNTYLYICGLRGMEKGIIEAFQNAAAARGLNWADLLARLQQEKRWRVEVY